MKIYNTTKISGMDSPTFLMVNELIIRNSQLIIKKVGEFIR